MDKNHIYLPRLSSSNTRDPRSARRDDFSSSAPRIRRREMTITDRRDVQITERKPEHIFSFATGETVKKWTTEITVEIAETYE